MGTAPCQCPKLADTIWAPIAGPKRGPWRARHHSGAILALAGSFAFGGGWLQMRTSKARTREETEGRLHLLDAQRESLLRSERERLAIALIWPQFVAPLRTYLR